MIAREGLFASGGPVLLACSGGGDSVALVALVARLAGELGVEPVVGHVHHGLRGEEADQDESAVRRLAGELGFGFAARRVDVEGARGARGGGVQAAGRRLRYAALREMADEVGAAWVATGHSADDRAETLLLNLVRGTGPRGLAGLRPKRADGVARPLIEMRREALRDWLRGQGIGWREDSSNEDQGFRRVRVRRELIPWLEDELNPRVVEGLAACARTLDGAAQVMEEAARAGLERARLPAPSGTARLDRRRLETYHPALRCMIVAGAARELIGDASPVAVGRIDAALRRDRGGELAPGVRLRLLDDWIVVTDSRRRAEPLPETTLAIGSTIEIGGWSFRAERARPDPARRGRWVAELAAPREPLVIRSRRPGDRFRPAGGPGGRKLSDYMIDRGIPEPERCGVPLLADRSGILWVIGHRLDERAVPGPGAREILRVVATPPRMDPQTDEE